jgi:hypothetical protein
MKIENIREAIELVRKRDTLNASIIGQELTLNIVDSEQFKKRNGTYVHNLTVSEGTARTVRALIVADLKNQLALIDAQLKEFGVEF